MFLLLICLTTHHLNVCSRLRQDECQQHHVPEIFRCLLCGGSAATCPRTSDNICSHGAVCFLDKLVSSVQWTPDPIIGSMSPSCDAVALSLIPLSAPSGPLSLPLVFSVVHPIVPCFLSAGLARNSKGFVSERCSLTLNGTHSFSFSVSAHTFTHI